MTQKSIGRLSPGSRLESCPRFTASNPRRHSIGLQEALNRRQALFLDGTCHAGEIAGLAYPRLLATLTEIALNEHEPAASDRL